MIHNIPDRIWAVAWRTFAGHEDDHVEGLADAITAAAPLIVAAELRRRADELDPPGGVS